MIKQTTSVFLLMLVAIAFAWLFVCGACADDDDDDDAALDSGDTVLESFPDLSGLTWMAEGKLLVVHDAKNEEGKLNDPRVEVLSISDDYEVTLSPVEIDWGGEEVSDDMESVCALSAADGDFLASESAQEGAPFTRIFRISIKEQATGWAGTVVDVFELPADSVNIEGMECLSSDDQQAIILLGERGGSDECPDGKLRLCRIDFATGEVVVQEEHIISVDDVDWSDPEGHRDISDLYLDTTGALWAVATEDPADGGPWRSVIYQLGTVAGDAVTIAEQWDIVARVDGLKVESLAAPIVDGSRFSLGTDDESYGGIWRPVP